VDPVWRIDAFSLADGQASVAVGWPDGVYRQDRAFLRRIDAARTPRLLAEAIRGNRA